MQLQQQVYFLLLHGTCSTPCHAPLWLIVQTQHTYGVSCICPPPRQEGWHLELDDPSEPLTYKGVVFNEMKGVYSSPDSMFYRTVQQVGAQTGTDGAAGRQQKSLLVLQCWRVVDAMGTTRHTVQRRCAPKCS